MNLKIEPQKSAGGTPSERIESLQEIQLATLNILEDFNVEKLRLEDTQRAVLNILDDFNSENANVERANRMLQLKSEELNRSNQELQEARDVLEDRVTERTTELETSLREKETLLREIHHRVKNNLQIIHSMLSLQLPQVKDAQAVELFKESQNRVFSMALIHEKLYQSESMAKIDLPEYVRGLTANLFLSYSVTGNTIRRRINVEDVSLDIDTVIPCALIINELVSNSLKHAFPASLRSEMASEISIDLHRGENHGLILSVSDNGVGLPQGFEIQNCRSLGLKLVGALVKQLNGTINIDTSGGARFVISFEPRSS